MLRPASLAVFFCVAAQPALAQVVQLPTFSVFSIQTSVMAPDRGAAYLGGARAYSTGRTAFSPAAVLGNSSFGQAAVAAGLAASATILDQDAMDRAVLAAAGGQNASPAISPPRPYVADFATPANHAARGFSLADAERMRDADVSARQNEAIDYVARARRAEADGKTSVAITYYQMAGRRASGELLAAISQRLAVLKAAVVARRAEM